MLLELLFIVAISLGANAAADESQSENEYCDQVVWGRWCDPDQTQLTLDWQARKLEPHTQPEIENLIFGID